MTDKAIAFYNNIIDNYTETCKKEKAETDKIMRAVWTDKRKQIERVFQKMYGKSIDKLIKV